VGRAVGSHRLRRHEPLRVADELTEAHGEQQLRTICGARHLPSLSLVSKAAGPLGGVSTLPARLLSCMSSDAPLPHRLLRPARLRGLDDGASPSSSVLPMSEFKDRTLLLGRRSRAGGDTGFAPVGSYPWKRPGDRAALIASTCAAAALSLRGRHVMWHVTTACLAAREDLKTARGGDLKLTTRGLLLPQLRD